MLPEIHSEINEGANDTVFKRAWQWIAVPAPLPELVATAQERRCALRVKCALSKRTMSIIWKPSVTVAAIIERERHFLLVEEETSDGIRFNQPAGHLDPGESLIQAVSREALEETAHEFVPDALVGVYMSRYLSNRTGEDVTYLRFAFCGRVGAQHDQPLDDGILRAVWMNYDELLACRDKHRSPLVLQCVDDYLAGKRSPLSTIYTHPSVTTEQHA